ncbi:MAG: hypothetical protein WBC44_00350, partial [Planctomycetaceae bacterium]
GRRSVRSTLSMAALSACRCNPVIRDFARRLKDQGKAHHVVLTTSMLKNQTTWTPRFALADSSSP